MFDRKITETNYIVSPSATINARNLSEKFSVGRILNKLIDEFKGAWARSVSLSSKLDFFRTVKVRGFEWEPYLDLIKSFQVRQSVAQLRTSSHQHNIETVRYHNIPRQMRQCEFRLSQMQSTGPIEDEIHMLYKCMLVEELRRNALLRLTTLLHTKCGISANHFIIAFIQHPPLYHCVYAATTALSLRLCCIHRFIIASMLHPPLYHLGLCCIHRFIIVSMLHPPTIKISHKDAVKVAISTKLMAQFVP